MTSDSQFALRRIIEEYSKVTRFCIICNYHNKIIDPLISRCSMFRFKPIDKNLIIKKLKEISKKENMNCSINNLKKIVDICRGDLRKAINFLQRCHNSFGDKINDVLLDEISGIISKKDFDELFKNCLIKDSNKVDEIIMKFYNDGYSLVNQIQVLHNRILNDDNYSGVEKSNIINALVEIDQNLIKGCDEYILFMKFAYYLMYINDK